MSNFFMIMRKDGPMTFKKFVYYQYIPNCIRSVNINMKSNFREDYCKFNGAIIIKNNSLNM